MKMKSFTLTILLLIFTVPFMHAKEKQNRLLSSSISLTNLSNNEELCVGNTVTIEWAGVDAGEEVIIEYSTNGGSNWIEITATATGLSYDWTVPNTPSENVLVRVKAPIQVEEFVCIDGAVRIGTQYWSCKNLDVTTYSNGDPIPQVTDPTEWENLTTGAWCYYNNDAGNNATYGKLYNWYAVNDPRGLAPAGWHVPTDDEWKTLEMYLGMSQAQADGTGYRGTDQGSKLAARADLWHDGNLEQNVNFEISGIHLLPGGYRNLNGDFDDIGNYCWIWTSSSSGPTHKWCRYFYWNDARVNRAPIYNQCGFSIRCVRD